MAYNATITVTLAISGTNPSGGGAINENTVAAVWQNQTSPALRMDYTLTGDGLPVNIEAPQSPQPEAQYALLLLPNGIMVTLIGTSGDIGYPMGSLGQSVLLPVGTNGQDGPAFILAAASQCVVTVWWI